MVRRIREKAFPEKGKVRKGIRKTKQASDMLEALI